MPGGDTLRAFRWLSRSTGGFLSGSESTASRCLTKSFSRSMATESQPTTEHLTREAPTAVWNVEPARATVYSFPRMEPLRVVAYPRNHLLMPLRKDILHRAIVYEGDRTRQGTASTKWRDDVHGSGRKLHAQKGTGNARVGDKKSPIRKGGGVAHGPHPRDFSTGLPRKIYDQAWRIALSYRYRRGQLFILDKEIRVPREDTPHTLKDIFLANNWGNEFGRSTLITDRPNELLIAGVQALAKHIKVRHRGDLDVKDLLETGRLIIEKQALDRILAHHSRDLVAKPAKARY
ncbi:ribosomal protein L4 domain-containing protein [Aspergillus coremiiformis]|uniref:Large ribosomal subunit protein uL4m n=1 Tax=Aspergillus coremiiformis TaxID=138285 RepID=A0A5N6YX48_9EURO|nr:ribosomal protein L4 domain-containing protein [Aspergillus coremiiformis]